MDPSITQGAADAPVARRLRIIMTQLSAYARQPVRDGENASKASKYARYAWVMQGMFEEVLDELSVTDADVLGGWFEQFGKIIEWCGSGDDSVLPDAMRAYLSENHPGELLAITAGENH